MPLSSSGDLLHSAASYLHDCLDALRTVARQAGSFSSSVAPRNALFLTLQVLGVTFPGGANLIDHMPNTTGMSITAYDYFLNLDRHILSIDWEILGCGDHKLSTYQPQGALADPTQCGPFDLAVDVYLNCASNKVFSYDPNKLPVDPIQGPLLIRELNSFRTNHELHPSGSSVYSYAFHAFAFAVNPATNVSVDIARFAITNPSDSFTTSSRSTNVTKGFVYDTDSGPTTVEIVAHALDVEISHSRLTQGISLCMFATNWILTITSAYITFSAVTKGRVGFAVVILHGSMVFAILGIRGLYASSPPFGAFLDAVGLFSQITIAVACSTVLFHTAVKSYLPARVSSRSPDKA